MELAAIRTPDNILSRPPRNADGYRNLSSWVEEAIWGHRLWYRETPWLLFLEFLNIAEAFHQQGALFVADLSTPLVLHRFHQRIALRNILFNNSALSRIADSNKADAVEWEEWIRCMNEESEPNTGIDYSYLKSRFPRFQDFAKTVDLLRQTVIEPDANRRWSSRFVFPFGPAALYEDLNISNGKAERQAINFGRTGDLLYMMLSRSSRAADLGDEFGKLLASSNLGNKMTTKLLAPSAGDDLSDQRNAGYLPYVKHPAYERLATDFLAILRLGLPSLDVFAHLVPLAALHVLMYQLETAAAWLGRVRPVFVCEVIAPRMEFVRQRATRSYLDNDGLPWAAVERCAHELFTSEVWKTSVEDPRLVSEVERLAAGIELLKDSMWMDVDDLGGVDSVEKLKERVFEKLHEKIDDNLRLVHSAYGRNCGLVSKRGTRSYRYAPTDSLLKTLVLANVRKRMEINEFLRCIFDRYRMIFGPLEAQGALSPLDYDETAFQKNRARLEERLRSMGLLNRLSDGVAYVENSLVI